MPSNGRWDLIRRFKIKELLTAERYREVFDGQYYVGVYVLGR